MAKSKKKKNADFQKIKLKVGKRLSKGDNITNLSFKTRQIHLTQTIRTGETSLPVTRKNLSIQDLLRQCDHHSVGPRVNAIAGIKELLLNSFSEFLIPSNVYGYGAVLKKISSMLIDNESDVRHSVINVFKLMFTKLKHGSKTMSSDNLISGNLFSHIHAYLCCAMNHIHEDVRLDALVLFDALLEAFPHAMVRQTGDLMKNLISMISSPIGIGAKGDTVTQRLSMNPDSKLPVMKFRARVLQRIKLTLQVALLEVVDVDVKSMSATRSSDEYIWSLYFDKNKEGAKQNTLIVSQEQTNRFSWILKGTALDMQDYIIKPSSLEEFMKLSVPILLQCWKEARASGFNDTAAGNVLSPDALEVMSLVVNVVELLFSLSATGCSKGCQNQLDSHMISTSFLRESYESHFTHNFMSHFPYAAHIQTKLPKKKKMKGHAQANDIPTQSSLSTLNLSICHIMSHLCSDYTHVKERPWLYKIQQFILNKFQSSPSTEHMKILIQILLNIFQNPSLVEIFVPAFEAACKYFLACKVKFSQKREVFNLFAHVSNNWDGWKNNSGLIMFGHHSYSAEMEGILSKFIKSLPKLLLRIPRNEPANIEWIKDVLSCISDSLNGRGNLSLSSEIGDSLTDILDPSTGLLRIRIEDVQMKVLSLLPLGPALSKEQLKHILLNVRRPVENPILPHRKSHSLACQAITFVSLGIRRNLPFSSQVKFNQMTQAESNHLSDYLKFMFSLLIGMTRKELEALFPANDDTVCATWKNVSYVVEKEQWDRHLDLASTICQEMANLHIQASPSDGYHDAFTFISNMEQLWKHTLTNYRNIHIMSAYSLFKFFHSIQYTYDKPSSDLAKMTVNVMACVLDSFYLPSRKSEKLSKEIVEQMKTVIAECLHSALHLLPELCNTLKEKELSSSSNEEKQSSQQAMEFLLSDHQLKTAISENNYIK